MTLPNSLDDLKLGCLLLVREKDTSPLPLEETNVTGQITGPVASITVMQRFGNPFKEVVELEYIFPLPHEAAIFDYEIKIGTRTIRADIKEAERARQTYQQAVDEGKQASLLEQRAGNLFSIEIGNVRPGDQIITTVRYQERLHYDDGSYEFVFPMGVMPRYHSPIEGKAGAARADSPLAMPDDKISPVTINLAVDTGVNAGELESKPISRTHEIAVSQENERRFTVALSGIPNKDFVMHFPVSAETLRATAWVSQDGDADTALITILPPRLDAKAEPDPREFIFIIDRSGSMSGGPLEHAKNAVRTCLRALGPNDTFLIQLFDDRVEWLDAKAQAATQENVDKSDKWLNQVHARGGTEILGAIDSALKLPIDPERMRYVVFLTDGGVSAEDQAIAQIGKLRGSARIFTFGVGPSVNRFLLDKMAQLGRGSAEFLSLNDDIETAITRFQDRISYPALMDITLKWKHAETWDTYPTTLPDLYVGEPLEIVTKVKHSGPVVLEMSGTRRKQAVKYTLTLPPTGTLDPSLHRLWARARIDSLLDERHSRKSDPEKIRTQVIGLALEHRLITPYTSFVAVDSEIAVGIDAEKRTVRVSTPLPEDLEIEGFFGAPGALGGSVTFLAAAPLNFSPPKGGGVSNLFASLNPFARPKKAVTGMNFMADVVPAAPGRLEAQQKTADKPASPITIAERIKQLARNQNMDGSWGKGDDQMEQTAAALLAFVRAGHTTRIGNYRRQVRKAAEWLQKAAAAALGKGGFGVFAAVRALTELEAATNGADTFGAGDLRAKLPAPQTDPERAALGEDQVSVPAKITTEDDVVVTALIAGFTDGASIPAVVQGNRLTDKLEIWLAVGKPQ